MPKRRRGEESIESPFRTNGRWFMPIGSHGKWYIYLHEWLIFYGKNVSKYTSPMDPFGMKQGGSQHLFQASAVEGEEDPARGLSSFNALHVALLHLTSADKGQQPTFKLLEITDFVGWLSKEMEQENIGNWAMNEFQRYSIYIYYIFSIYSLWIEMIGLKKKQLGFV